MAPRFATSWLYPLLAGLLVLAFLAQCVVMSRLKSPAFDEPAHLAAGLAYAATGQVRANPQHPPLVKMMSGLTLRLAGLGLPELPDTERLVRGEPAETAVGNAIIARGGPDRVMFWARLPSILVAAFLGILVFAWGRRVIGDLAALIALALTVLDPTVSAHSIFVTMDVAFGAFTLLFCYALWRYLHRPNDVRLGLCGMALGAALVTKFSALCLLPVAAALVFAAILRPPPTAGGRPGLLRPYERGDPRVASADAVYGLPAGVLALLAMVLIAAAVVQLAYLSPDGLFRYASGVQRVNADHDPNYQVFLAGHLGHNFPGYLAVAYLLKEPIATLVLVGLGLGALLRTSAVTPLGKLFLLLPPVTIFATHSFWADNLGIRYIIPALPFTHLIGGVGVAWLLRSGARWARPVAILLGVWLLTTAAGIYPDALAYFNEGACLPHGANRIGIDGGTRCGTSWLDDSNVDWNQGIKQLKAWVDAHAAGRHLRLAAMGPFPPEVYGLSFEEVDWATLLQPRRAGLHAVSAHFVARAPAAAENRGSNAADWLRRTPPIAIVGHSFYIYDLAPPPSGP